MVSAGERILQKLSPGTTGLCFLLSRVGYWRERMINMYDMYIIPKEVKSCIIYTSPSWYIFIMKKILANTNLKWSRTVKILY